MSRRGTHLAGRAFGLAEAVPWAPNRAAATTPTTRAAAMERGRRLAIPDIRVRNSPRRPRCPASASGLLLFLVLLLVEARYHRLGLVDGAPDDATGVRVDLGTR